MSQYIPTNDLDRAIMAMRRSQAGLPELCQQLAQGELWFLLPYHPEMVDAEIQIQNGSPLPFAVLTDDRGELVPIFSSEERVEEGLKRGKVPPRTFLFGSMPAQQVLEILGQAELRAVLNKSCSTGEMILPPDMMRDLADGTLLQPEVLRSGINQPFKANLISPADYPTNLIQPVFEVLRRHRNFRAVWIFLRPPAPAPPAVKPHYALLFLMEPRDAAIFHEVNLVANAVRGENQVSLGLVDENNVEYIAALFQRAPPFYLAADYGAPPGKS